MDAEPSRRRRVAPRACWPPRPTPVAPQTGRQQPRRMQNTAHVSETALGAKQTGLTLDSFRVARTATSNQQPAINQHPLCNQIRSDQSTLPTNVLAQELEPHSHSPLSLPPPPRPPPSPPLYCRESFFSCPVPSSPGTAGKHRLSLPRRFSPRRKREKEKKVKERVSHSRVRNLCCCFAFLTTLLPPPPPNIGSIGRINPTEETNNVT